MDESEEPHADPEPSPVESASGEPEASTDGIPKDKAPWLAPFRYPKGVSGNLAGRPSAAKLRAKQIATAYEAMLEGQITKALAKDLKLPDSFVGLTFREALAIGQGGAAARGQTEAAREIGDRVDGKVETAVNIRTASMMDDILRDLWERKMAGRPARALNAVAEIAEGEVEGEPEEIGQEEGEGGEP